MVWTCSSLSDMSFLNFCTPTLRSMCHGGIWRVETRCLIDLAHGRDSSNVLSDIGAIDPGSWQFWHLAWKIGATSLVNVTFLAWSAASAADGRTSNVPTARAPRLRWRLAPTITGSFHGRCRVRRHSHRQRHDDPRDSGF